MAGILLHPTSLPGRFGIGDLGPEAVRFLDWSSAAGQTIWQMLPLGPSGFEASPYAAQSSVAGNPLVISPEWLVEDGLADAAALESAPVFHEGRVDFDGSAPWKEGFLRASWRRFRTAAPLEAREAFHAFENAPEQDDWLPTWALFAALKGHYRGAAWTTWDPPLRRREPRALERAGRDLADETGYQTWLQFVFFRQWGRLRTEASAHGIEIFGDMPIYVPLDSADVWDAPEWFQLDEDLSPIAVAGVPPDYFSETGQLWGAPLYRWDRIEADGFRWWVRRVRAALRKFDLLRLDHFRGFAAYWSVPAGAADARGGHWEPGPGLRLFRALESALGDLPLVAEDLGEITDDVRALRDALGIPGMRVLQFGLGHPESEHHPSRIPVRSVVYTGTHDNDTARGWFEALGADERARVAADLGLGPGDEDDEIPWRMIRAAYETAAERAIVPLQDVLGLGSDARMNTPGIASGNWSFRLRPGSPARDDAVRLRGLATSCGRARA